ncbi:siderophore-interacting protein, partial [Streptomyces corynorhini]
AARTASSAPGAPSSRTSQVTRASAAVRSGDRRPLRTAADARVTWLVREEGAPGALEAVRAASPRGSAPYAWIAGESGTVKELRRHLVRERELDRRRVTFVGYWRRGLSEEQLRERAAAGAGAA